MTAPRIGVAAFSVSQLAQRWSVSERSIRREIDAGRLRHFRIQTLIRVPTEEVERIEGCGSYSTEGAGTQPAKRQEASEGLPSAQVIVLSPSRD